MESTSRASYYPKGDRSSSVAKPRLLESQFRACEASISGMQEHDDNVGYSQVSELTQDSRLTSQSQPKSNSWFNKKRSTLLRSIQRPRMDQHRASTSSVHTPSMYTPSQVSFTPQATGKRERDYDSHRAPRTVERVKAIVESIMRKEKDALIFENEKQHEIWRKEMLQTFQDDHEAAQAAWNARSKELTKLAKSTESRMAELDMKLAESHDVHEDRIAVLTRMTASVESAAKKVLDTAETTMERIQRAGSSIVDNALPRLQGQVSAMISKMIGSLGKPLHVSKSTIIAEQSPLESQSIIVENDEPQTVRKDHRRSSTKRRRSKHESDSNKENEPPSKKRKPASSRNKSKAISPFKPLDIVAVEPSTSAKSWTSPLKDDPTIESSFTTPVAARRHRRRTFARARPVSAFKSDWEFSQPDF